MESSENPVYQSIREFDRAEIERAINENDIDVLMLAALSASLYGEDPEWAQDLCLLLANHDHFNIRGNAILGFAHIARVSGKLDEAKVKQVIEKGLMDEDPFVRDHADAAKHDTGYFLGWKFKK